MTRRLDPKLRAERVFSFRNDLPDQWYDLNNATDPAKPLQATFMVRREDFPPNLKEDDIKTRRLLAYFAPKDGEAFEVGVADLGLRWGTGPSDTVGASGPVTSSSDVISTGELPQNHKWGAFITRTPIGDWTFTIDPASRQLFADGKVDDILFVVTYRAELPAWI